MAGPGGVHAALSGCESRGGQAEAGGGEDETGELQTRAAEDRTVDVARIVECWHSSCYGPNDLCWHRWIESSECQFRLVTTVLRAATNSAAATSAAAIA